MLNQRSAIFMSLPFVSIVCMYAAALDARGALRHRGAARGHPAADRIAGNPARELLARLPPADLGHEHKADFVAAHLRAFQPRRPAADYRAAREHLEGLAQLDLV